MHVKQVPFICFCRGQQPIDGSGLGIDRPAELQAKDDEFEAYRKRMMLAYRFRPNPLVRQYRYRFISYILICQSNLIAIDSCQFWMSLAFAK